MLLATPISKARKTTGLMCSTLLAISMSACEGSSGGAPLDSLTAPVQAKTVVADRSLPVTASQDGDPQFLSLSVSEPINAGSYQIGPSDVLGISVFQVPELKIDVQVASNGTITLPIVGILNVEGKQAQEIGSDIAARLKAKYLQSPQVTVFVKSHNSQKIVVSGAVKSPGSIVMTGNTTLLSAISDAKGFTDLADTTAVVIFRHAHGHKYAARFNLDDIQSGKAADPSLMAGDLVIVDSSDVKSWTKTLLPVLATAGVFVALL